MIALCVILFSGGMGTKISAIRPVIAPGLVLSTIGVLLTALVTGLFIWFLSGLSWTNIHFAFMPSLLLAATMSSTDSASVFGILGSQKVGMRHNLRPLLELESGSNDPMAYMLTIILIETITLGGELSGWKVAGQLLMQFGIGGGMGWAMGKLTLRLIDLYRRWGGKAGHDEDPSQATAMLSILVLGSVFLTFSATTELAGNGYLAVYICGIVLGNERLPNHRGISKFMDGMTWLMQIVVFLMLGLLVNPHEMLDVAAVSLLIGVVYDTRRASAQRVSLAGSFPQHNHPFQGVDFVGGIARSRSHNLCHLSCGGRTRGSRTHIQYSVFRHAAVIADSGHYGHTFGPTAGTCG